MKFRLILKTTYHDNTNLVLTKIIILLCNSWTKLWVGY